MEVIVLSFFIVFGSSYGVGTVLLERTGSKD